MVTARRITALLSLSSIVAVAVACSSSGTSSPADNSSSSSGSTPPSATPGGDDAGADAPPPTAPPSACTLADITGVASVNPTFKIYKPPTSQPDTMTGGTIAGKYRVDKGTVYLPTNLESAINLDKCQGTLTAWADFEGSDFKFHMDYNFDIDSVLGPYQFKDTVKDSGTFTINVATLVRETTCDPTAPPQNAELSFTDNGTRGTIVVKTTVSTPLGPGDVYVQLEASKTP
jgi:hypothetical protein